MRKLLAILILVALLSACGGAEPAATRPPTAPPSATAQPTATVEPTATTVPTDTPVPHTHTPRPTDTLAPTSTPRPTDTPAPTNTRAPTNTPPPPTATAVALTEADEAAFGESVASTTFTRFPCPSRCCLSASGGNLAKRSTLLARRTR